MAERYWWNTLPDGRWVDLTPRPLGVAQLLLVEPLEATAKERQVLSRPQAELAGRYLRAKFPETWKKLEKKMEILKTKEVKEVKEMKKVEKEEKKEVKQVEKPAKAAKAPTLDYSKWSNIVDSDDEEEPKVPDEDVGVKDLAEGQKAKKEPPIPDYLLGSTGGGGGTNCLTSIVKMLDSEQTQENVHQSAGFALTLLFVLLSISERDIPPYHQ